MRIAKVTDSSVPRLDVEFRGTVAARMRASLERIFFFNRNQRSLQSRIRAIVAETGAPFIAEDGGSIWLAVPSGKLQCLFACRRDAELVGVIMFDRPSVEQLRICHLAIEVEGDFEDELNHTLVPTMIDRVKRIGRCISGVRRIQLPYRHHSFLRVSEDLD